jgi:hypothetical protein
LLAWPRNLSSAVSSSAYVRIRRVALPYFKRQYYIALYIEVIDGIVKNTKIWHAFDLSHNLKKYIAYLTHLPQQLKIYYAG